MRIAAYPKCYEKAIVWDRTMTVFDWIEEATLLDVDGLEMYSGFLVSSKPSYLDSVRDAILSAGFAMPMMCHSPDFTNPDADARKRSFDLQASTIRVTKHLGGAGAICRVLSGQRYPEVDMMQGIEWVVDAIENLILIAKENDVVLAMENHYKDGFWKYPEFAQKKDVFLQILNSIEEREYFGVQYDPSNAIVAGCDPVEFLETVAPRVVSVHASDRWLAEGTTLEELRQSDGTIGYSPNLRHGVIGQGLNDYDQIIRILHEQKYAGWISIEDGMNGLGEMRESVDFLRRKIAAHVSEED